MWAAAAGHTRPGRQGCNMVGWRGMSVHWAKQGLMVKLGLRRAFDSVDRRALATKISSWMGEEFSRLIDDLGREFVTC